MVHKEDHLPYTLDRRRFRLCISVDREFLDLYLDGEPLLLGQDKDISSVQGKYNCMAEPSASHVWPYWCNRLVNSRPIALAVLACHASKASAISWLIIVQFVIFE